jgi:hypothetical protein
VENPSSGVLDLQTDIRAKRVTNAILGFWVPKTLYMPYLHGFGESLNNQGIIWKHTAKIQILVVPTFFIHDFF